MMCGTMERDLCAVAEAVGAEQLDMYTPLLPYAETPDFAADGVHPEGGAQRVNAPNYLMKMRQIT